MFQSLRSRRSPACGDIVGCFQKLDPFGQPSVTRRLRGRAHPRIVAARSDLAKGLALIVAGATLLIPGLVLLLQAAAAALIEAGLADYWSLAIFGGSAFLLGTILTAVGRRRMRLARLKPEKALVGLERDAAMAKGTRHATTQRAA